MNQLTLAEVCQPTLLGQSDLDCSILPFSGDCTVELQQILPQLTNDAKEIIASNLHYTDRARCLRLTASVYHKESCGERIQDLRRLNDAMIMSDMLRQIIIQAQKAMSNSLPESPFQQAGGLFTTQSFGCFIFALRNHLHALQETQLKLAIMLNEAETDEHCIRLIQHFPTAAQMLRRVQSYVEGFDEHTENIQKIICATSHIMPPV